MNNEIKRLMDEPAADESPSGMGLNEYRMQSGSKMAAAIDKLRLALMQLRSVEQFMDICDDGQTVEAWEFDMINPVINTMFLQWFLHAVDEDAEEDDVTDNIRRFHCDGDWKWWNVRDVNEHEAILQLEIHGYPVSGLDALRWLCSHCGIDSLDEI